MSFVDLYAGAGPGISSSGGGEPAAAVFGVPFDSTHSYRPGARFGPDAIRGAFNNIEVFHPELGADLEEAAIEDLGNLRHTASAQEMVSMVRKVAGELAASRRQVIMLGGEHLATYGAYPAFPRGTGYVVFDAHYDLRDRYGDMRLSHASYLRRIAEEAGGDAILHVGARAFAAEEAAFLRESGIRTVTDRDVREGRGPAMVADAASTMGSVYASLDLDVLDPAFAPGVGNPEAEGITSRELMSMLRALGDARVAGADVVELCPPYDTGAAAAVAAKAVSAIVAMGLR